VSKFREPEELCGEVAQVGYLAWHSRSEEKHKAGQKQTQCAHCGLWRWPDEAAQCSKFTPQQRPKLTHLGGRHYMVEPSGSEVKE
jgi:hypothetical protein